MSAKHDLLDLADFKLLDKALKPFLGPQVTRYAGKPESPICNCGLRAEVLLADTENSHRLLVKDVEHEDGEEVRKDQVCPEIADLLLLVRMPPGGLRYLTVFSEEGFSVGNGSPSGGVEVHRAKEMRVYGCQDHRGKEYHNREYTDSHPKEVEELESQVSVTVPYHPERKAHVQRTRPGRQTPGSAPR